MLHSFVNFNSFPHNFPRIFPTTRLHSSRMRTARTLTVSPSMLCRGRVSAPSWCLLWAGVSAPGGCLLLGGCLLQGGVCWGGGVVGGGANSTGRGRQHMILSNFPKNCRKLRTFGALGEEGGTCRGRLLDPPLRFVNFYINWQRWIQDLPGVPYPPPKIQKLHENKNLNRGWGSGSSRPKCYYVDPPLVSCM